MDREPQPQHRSRRSIRLADHDYSFPGAYFVTICTAGRECVLGAVENGILRLSLYGQIADYHWRALPQHFPGIELDTFVVMPNHIHGVVVINERRGVGAKDWDDGHVDRTPGMWSQSFAPTVRADEGRPCGTTRGSLGAIIQTFKAVTARKVNRIAKTPGTIFWQRNYYEHVIRNGESAEEIRRYIDENPLRWAEDKYYR